MGKLFWALTFGALILIAAWLFGGDGSFSGPAAGPNQAPPPAARLDPPGRALPNTVAEEARPIQVNIPEFIPHPATLGPVLDANELRSAVEEKDPCTLLNEGVVDHASLKDVFGLLQSRGDHMGSDGPWNFIPLHAFFEAFSQPDAVQALKILDFARNDVCRFFAALLRADLLDGFTNPQPDYIGALETMEQLKGAFPGNGAISFFAGAIRRKRGDPEADLRREWEEAMAKSDFDGFHTRLLRVIWEAGVRDPKLFALAASLYARVPSPRIKDAARSIRKRIVAADLPWARAALSFGKLWMSEGLKEQRRAPDIYWSPEEYELGHGIALAAIGVLGPDKDARGVDVPMPPLYQLVMAGRRGPWDGKYIPTRVGTGRCREADLQQQVRELDQEHKNYLIDQGHR